ncbi:MAG: hypothetical protein A2504_11420 [Bdellovibrionales bacterium RIFOXYD12_FULL_39_22]|nr:MAG: hypothetical protein A2385_15935 [Bdellovibrionales bacterium RIFOXYB1_FULL_39_21]OFZ44552.1 MAG: hypothetical protein A2485_06960 [Bdellovibrionales bacterium RIFOXYC12_FULL_39_17]OFZ49806.1 MAG: hypothetical protein A2404_00505 [Bdellovibrionales bacterium RIFOXYC1_FULL_39_130]OFZ76811.1 MAG: hypothetical protein A2560_05305 [Bdellovibrionales bacterium RIFOXYD1_FULL_39_84]OFZ95738.1 MAG: hypothetical protein A2504_11420 [Bdellovibrionales bacterium RIFOXYD12_FULL_39_22]HLE10756.1 he
MSIAKKLIDTLKENLPTARAKVSDSYIQLVALYPLMAITTSSQHKEALKVIEKLITFSSTSAALAKDDGLLTYLNTLSELVSDYEKKHYTPEKTTGRDMLVYLMELQNLTQKDLADELGGQPIVSKILKGERELNLRHIKALAKRFGVSPSVFI